MLLPYDKELLAIAAEQSGLSRDIFEEIDEKESFGFFQNALNSVLGSHNSYICNENIFQLQSQTILDISHKGSCIFVGRCADYVLRNNENVLKVFLCAPLANRQKQIAAKQHITVDEAAKQKTVCVLQFLYKQNVGAGIFLRLVYQYIADRYRKNGRFYSEFFSQ